MVQSLLTSRPDEAFGYLSKAAGFVSNLASRHIMGLSFCHRLTSLHYRKPRTRLKKRAGKLISFKRCLLALNLHGKSQARGYSMGPR